MSRRPPTPETLDGHPLSPVLVARLGRLIDVIYDFDPLREPAATVALATQALRATCTWGERGWVSRRTLALNGGMGPALILR